MSKKKKKFKPDYVIEKHGDTYVDPKSVYCPECGQEMKYATNSGTCYRRTFYDRTVYKTFYRCGACGCEISKKTKQKPEWHKAHGFINIALIIACLSSAVLFFVLGLVKLLGRSVETSILIIPIIIFLVSGIIADWSVCQFDKE